MPPSFQVPHDTGASLDPTIAAVENRLSGSQNALQLIPPAGAAPHQGHQLPISGAPTKPSAAALLPGRRPISPFPEVKVALIFLFSTWGTRPKPSKDQEGHFCDRPLMVAEEAVGPILPAGGSVYLSLGWLHRQGWPKSPPGLPRSHRKPV